MTISKGMLVYCCEHLIRGSISGFGIVLRVVEHRNQVFVEPITQSDYSFSNLYPWYLDTDIVVDCDSFLMKTLLGVEDG